MTTAPDTRFRRYRSSPANGVDRRAFISSTALLAVGLAATACGGTSGRSTAKAVPDQDLVARFAKYRVASEPNGDLAKVVWPPYVTNGPAEVKTLYEFQVTHGELMRWMPCYCGCGSAGHKSNRDCYIKSVRGDGSVVFDSMAPT